MGVPPGAAGAGAGAAGATHIVFRVLVGFAVYQQRDNGRVPSSRGLMQRRIRALRTPTEIKARMARWRTRERVSTLRLLSPSQLRKFSDEERHRLHALPCASRASAPNAAAAAGCRNASRATATHHVFRVHVRSLLDQKRRQRRVTVLRDDVQRRFIVLRAQRK